MKVLQVNNVYDRLSTGKIVADLHHEYLMKHIDSYVCYARGPEVDLDRVFKFNWEFYAHLNKVRAYLTGIRYGGNILSTLLLIHKIKIIKPDVVHLHCINDDSVNIYIILKYLKKKRIKTVVTLHAEFFYTANCGNAFECDRWKTGCGGCPQIRRMCTLFDNTRRAWKKMSEAFIGFLSNNILIISVSPWLMNRAQQSPFLYKYMHQSILNGIDTNVFYRRSDTNIVRKNLGLNSHPVVMYVTSHFPSYAKGGNYILELAKLMPQINFLVLGEKTDIKDLPSNIILLGRIYEREKMAVYYSLSDITIIVSKAETFSMPVAESLCCGTPVVGFKAGGPETICIHDYCRLVDYGDIESLKKEIISLLRHTFDRNMICEQAKRKYSKETMAEEYICVYNYLMNKNEDNLI